MASPTLVFDSPLEPADFHGRSDVVKYVCDRLSTPHLPSTSVVGGPKTGKTSLLRYLASQHADALLKGRARVYLDVQLLSSTATPSDFWISVFRAMDALSLPAPLGGIVAKKLDARQTRRLDAYDAEDVFDACARTSTPVALLLDNFENLLKNPSFWGDFFHLLRALGQRDPRGLAFMTATQRPLLDLWEDRFGSPFYNIFVNKRLGRLSPDEIDTHLRKIVVAALPNADVKAMAALVGAASDRHPYLVSFVTGIVLERLSGGLTADPDVVRERLRDRTGPAAQLARQIYSVLTISERTALEMLRTLPQNLTSSQRAALQRLDEDCLLPPGTRLA